MNYKILKHHIADCYALAKVIECVWPTPWAYIDPEKVEYRDKIGRLRSGTSGSRWFRIRCNCTKCPAEIIVSETYMLACLASGRFALRRNPGL